jgi:hypothetical protein
MRSKTNLGILSLCDLLLIMLLYTGKVQTRSDLWVVLGMGLPIGQNQRRLPWEADLQRLMIMNKEAVDLDGLFLAVGKDGSLASIKLIDGVIRCTNTAFHNGYFEDLNLYNENRDLFHVVSASPISNHLFASIYRHIFNKIDLHLECIFVKTVEQAELIDVVNKSLRRDSAFWSSSGELENIIESVNNSSRLSDILRCLNI